MKPLRPALRRWPISRPPATPPASRPPSSRASCRPRRWPGPMLKAVAGQADLSGGTASAADVARQVTSAVIGALPAIAGKTAESSVSGQHAGRGRQHPLHLGQQAQPEQRLQRRRHEPGLGGRRQLRPPRRPALERHRLGGLPAGRPLHGQRARRPGPRHLQLLQRPGEGRSVCSALDLAGQSIASTFTTWARPAALDDFGYC